MGLKARVKAQNQKTGYNNHIFSTVKSNKFSPPKLQFATPDIAPL